MLARVGGIPDTAVTDYVFGRDDALGYALAAVTFVRMTLAITLFAMGLRSYRETVARRDSWRSS